MGQIGIVTHAFDSPVDEDTKMMLIFKYVLRFAFSCQKIIFAFSFFKLFLATVSIPF
jgi:hypothetical protein